MRSLEIALIVVNAVVLAFAVAIRGVLSCSRFLGIVA